MLNAIYSIWINTFKNVKTKIVLLNFMKVGFIAEFLLRLVLAGQ